MSALTARGTTSKMRAKGKLMARRMMSALEFDGALSRLNISLKDAEKLLDLTARQVYRYRHGESTVPVPVALLLNLMIEYDIPVEALLEDDETA